MWARAGRGTCSSSGHFLSRYSLQARLPSRSASRHRPPEVLEPSCLPPLANLPIFGKKVDSLGPQLLVPPTCRVGGGCRFYLGQRPGLNAINTLIPYLQVLPRTCSPRGQGPCAYRERRRNPPKKTHCSLVGSTAVQFQNGRSAPLERSRPVNAEKNGRRGAATRASPAAPPPAFPAQPPTSEDAELARGVAARSPSAAAWTLAPDRAVKGWHVARRLKQRR